MEFAARDSLTDANRERHQLPLFQKLPMGPLGMGTDDPAARASLTIIYDQTVHCLCARHPGMVASGCPNRTLVYCRPDAHCKWHPAKGTQRVACSQHCQGLTNTTAIE